MDGMSDTDQGWPSELSYDEAESAPGQSEWAQKERWRAGWRPHPDPTVGTGELRDVFRRVMRRGYAAYLAGERAMPVLFACDSEFASMWQIGYDHARFDAELRSCPGL